MRDPSPDRAIHVRPATEADQEHIVAIVREARINPMDLKWPNFVVAVDEATNAIVGTAQIKSHRDGSRELASIAVVPSHQRRGIAHQLIEHLLADSEDTLFLTCRSEMGPFYERFGFRVVPEGELTPYFRRLRKVAGVFELFAREGATLLVMKREGGSAAALKGP